MIDEVVILAAGKSTRMESQKNKVLENLAGRPMIQYVLDTTSELGILAPIVVIGHQATEVTAAVKNYGKLTPIFVEQENPAGGTGDAVAVAASFLAGEYVAVLYGDMPFIQAETLFSLGAAVTEAEAVLGLMTTKIASDSHFGRVTRDAAGGVTGIVEWKNASEEQRQITEGNVGVYVFRTQWLLAALPRLAPNSVTGELYLTDLVALAVETHQSVVTQLVTNPREALGVNTPSELAVAEEAATRTV